MINYTSQQWRAYLMEAFGLAGFVIIAGLLTIFLEHPALPVMQSWLVKYSLLRRIPLGIIMGIYIMIIVFLTGKKSGAHINPAVTLAFLSLKKIQKKDAILYIIIQFAGAIAGAGLLTITLGKWFSHPVINYGNTAPKPPHGSAAAFIAEFIISFIMMLVLLITASSKKFEKYLTVFSGILMTVYIIFELPFSGMSLNPARSFAASLISGKYEYLWIYFVSPVTAMLTAAEVYRQWRLRQIKYTKVGTDFIELPQYPIFKK